MRETLADMVDLLGHKVHQAGDGREALEILRREPVEILITDIDMPRCDGISLLNQIETPPPVVIVYSALDRYSPTALNDLAGATVLRILRKPAPPAKIIAVLADAVAELEVREDNSGAR